MCIRDSVRDESHVLGDERFIVIRPLFDVSLDEQLTVRFKKAGDFVEKAIGQDEALLMALLPPRIGEMDEHAAERPIRPQARKGGPSVLGEHPRTFAEPPLRETLVDHGRPLSADLETEQSGARFGLRSLDEKPASTRTDLDFDPVASNQRPQVY